MGRAIDRTHGSTTPETKRRQDYSIVLNAFEGAHHLVTLRLLARFLVAVKSVEFGLHEGVRSLFSARFFQNGKVASTEQVVLGKT